MLAWTIAKLSEQYHFAGFKLSINLQVELSSVYMCQALIDWETWDNSGGLGFTLRWSRMMYGQHVQLDRWMIVISHHLLASYMTTILLQGYWWIHKYVFLTMPKVKITIQATVYYRSLLFACVSIFLDHSETFLNMFNHPPDTRVIEPSSVSFSFFQEEISISSMKYILTLTRPIFSHTTSTTPLITSWCKCKWSVILPGHCISSLCLGRGGIGGWVGGLFMEWLSFMTS